MRLKCGIQAASQNHINQINSKIITIDYMKQEEQLGCICPISKSLVRTRPENLSFGVFFASTPILDLEKIICWAKFYPKIIAPSTTHSTVLCLTEKEIENLRKGRPIHPAKRRVSHLN